MWEKGKTGNPDGRPHKGEAMVELLDQYLNEENTLTNRLYKHDIALALVQKAADGDLMAIKQIYDRMVGRPREAVEISGPGGGAIVIVRQGDYDGA